MLLEQPANSVDLPSVCEQTSHCSFTVTRFLYLLVDAATWNILKGHNLPRISRPGARTPVGLPSNANAGYRLSRFRIRLPRGHGLVFVADVLYSDW